MHLRGISYALTASLMFGLGAVLAKLVGQEVDATVVAFLDLAVGGLLLSIGLLLTGAPLFKALSLFKRADWIDFVLLSCPGTALPLLLIVAGFARTSALEGGFLLQINGVAALVFAVLLLGERIRLKQSVGMILLLLGSALVIFKGAGGVSWGSGVGGDLLILFGAVGLGFGFIPAKRLVQRVEVLPLTALRLLLGSLTLLPVLAFQLVIGPHPLLWRPAPDILWVLPTYIVTNFCLGYLSQQEGLRLLKAWEVAAIMQTVPLFSTFFAILLLRDTMTLVQVGGGALALVGGVIVSLNNEKPAGQAATVLASGQEDAAPNMAEVDP